MKNFDKPARVQYTEHRCPTSWQRFSNEVGLHPTQKPVSLMDYLIRTYTKQGETVLDNTMGSGTTGIACVRTDRNFIGIEKYDTHYATATERITNCDRQKDLSI